MIHILLYFSALLSFTTLHAVEAIKIPTANTRAESAAKRNDSISQKKSSTANAGTKSSENSDEIKKYNPSSQDGVPTTCVPKNKRSDEIPYTKCPIIANPDDKNKK